MQFKYLLQQDIFDKKNEFSQLEHILSFTFRPKSILLGWDQFIIYIFITLNSLSSEPNPRSSKIEKFKYSFQRNLHVFSPCELLLICSKD